MDIIRSSSNEIALQLSNFQQNLKTKLFGDSLLNLTDKNMDKVKKEFVYAFNRLILKFKNTDHFLPYIEKIIKYYNKKVIVPFQSFLVFLNNYNGQCISPHPAILIFVL